MRNKGMLKEKVFEFFRSMCGSSIFSKKSSKSYEQGVSDCIKYFKDRIWHKITDEESYPEPYEFVMVVDDCGETNIAYCDIDYDWYISNGENELKLVSKVVKWIELS